MSNPSPLSRTRYDLALLLTVIVWGINFPVIKTALVAMHPFALNVFRFGVSSVTMAVVLGLRHNRGPGTLRSLLKTHPWRIAGLGLLGTLLYQVFFILGIARTTAGTAALIMASAPAWTVIAGHVRGYERLDRLTAAGLLLSLAGTAIVVFGGQERISLSDQTLAGNLLMLGASLMWGLYTAFARPSTRFIPPLELSFLGLIVALPFLVLLGLPHMVTIEWTLATWDVWLAILYSGALSTGLAVVVWNVSVKHAGANYTAVFGNLVPVVAIVGGFLLLDEPIAGAQLTGGAIAICGVLLMRFKGTIRKMGVSRT